MKCKVTLKICDLSFLVSNLSFEGYIYNPHWFSLLKNLLISNEFGNFVTGGKEELGVASFRMHIADPFFPQQYLRKYISFRDTTYVNNGSFSNFPCNHHLHLYKKFVISPDLMNFWWKLQIICQTQCTVWSLGNFCITL